jgi:hypothetical protein
LPPTQAIALSSDRTHYTSSSTITVTLTNQYLTSIITFDHQSGCTILTLQRQTNSGWQPVGACAMGRATRQITIAAGETIQIMLAPGAGQLQARLWPTGTYRAVFHYTLPEQDTVAAVDTAVFTIG